MTYFPKDPVDNMIWEPENGIFYTYNAAIKAWSRAEGGIPGIATALNDGLMSVGDFKKLNRVVIPPPQSTITSASCSATFTGGFIDLIAGDEFVSIDGTARLMNVVAGIGESEATVVDRELHQRTNSFDFRIDTTTLYDYMVEHNKFRVIANRGRQGPPGDAGEDGSDNLPHGEDGLTGNRGANAPFDHQLYLDNVDFVRKQSVQRAIINISTEEVSPAENYIIITRGDIGNDEACPSTVRLTSELESSWAVCVPVDTHIASMTATNCYTCIDTLYYVDLSSILSSIRNEFNKEVQQLKNGMEEIVSFWLTIISGVFDEQKAALCCALEYCVSAKRNAETRRYIEEQRIQAAQGNFGLDIKGSPTDSEKNVTITQQACEPYGFGYDNVNDIPNNQDPIGGSNCVPHIMYDVNGNPIKYPECPPGFTPRNEYRQWIRSLQATTAPPLSIARTTTQLPNIAALAITKPTVVESDIALLSNKAIFHLDSDHREVAIYMAPGKYYVSVASCCLRIGDKFTAKCEIQYNSSGIQKRSIPDFGHSNLDDARTAYKNLNIQIKHDGGSVIVRLFDGDISGSVDVVVLNKIEAMDAENLVLKTLEAPDNKPLLPHEVLAYDKLKLCKVSADQIRWLERCWKLKDCVSAIVEFNNQEYIIVFKEDLQLSCPVGTGKVSVAWPVIDRLSFVPAAGDTMFRFDAELQKLVIGLLRSGKYISKIGSLRSITTIIFPQHED